MGQTELATMTAPKSTAPDLCEAAVALEAAQLLEEIENYLATQKRTAHPLVTRTTQELVDEALAQLKPAAVEAELLPPSTLLKLLPTKVLRYLRGTSTSAGRPLSVAEHLQLTTLTLQRFGWTGHGELRTRSGRCCIAGAQTVLRQLGYGDERLIREAGAHLDRVLVQRGESGPYYLWNDRPGRTVEQVLDLLDAARMTASDLRH